MDAELRTSEVHCEQRTAFAGIALKQNGHSLVAGGGGAGAGFLKRFSCRITRKIANATITKLITVLTNWP